MKKIIKKINPDSQLRLINELANTGYDSPESRLYLENLLVELAEYISLPENEFFSKPIINLDE